jgi:hypothetical protein
MTIAEPLHPLEAPRQVVVPHDDLQALVGWLHAAFDRPPQTPDMRVMLARADALLEGALVAERDALQPHPPHRQCGCADCAPSFAESWATGDEDLDALLNQTQAQPNLAWAGAVARPALERVLRRLQSGEGAR